jgi:hypothetical protein
VRLREDRVRFRRFVQSMIAVACAIEAVRVEHGEGYAMDLWLNTMDALELFERDCLHEEDADYVGVVEQEAA